MREVSREEVLEYEIVDSKKICGEGNINSIKREDGNWKSYIGIERIKLSCRLKGVCHLMRI
jgi:hypothetical protein